MTNFEIIEGTKDVVITVIHNKVNKIRTRPMVLYSDDETGIVEMAIEINKKTGATVIVNNSKIDLNNDNEFIKGSGVMKEMLGIINEIKPRVVLDLHGMADKGLLFNNSFNNGMRIMREVLEEKIIGDRPDIDLEIRRKSSSNFITCRGTVLKELAKYLTLNGLVTDMEAVYPGGNFIAKVANKERDVIAIEIANRIRSDEKLKERVIIAISEFIRYMRGEKVESELQPAFNVDERFKKLEEEEIKKQTGFTNHISEVGQYVG